MYNVCTYYFPDTSSTKYIYADDVALTFSAPTFSQSEKNLTEDVTTVQEYLSKWRLKLSTNKTVCSVFHIRNHHARYQLIVESSPGKLLSLQSNLTYLGIALDRSLTFKDHILKFKNKVSSRVALIKRLAGLTWGCSFNVLRASVERIGDFCDPNPVQYCHYVIRSNPNPVVGLLSKYLIQSCLYPKNSD